MILKWFKGLCPPGKSVQIKVPRRGLKLDPRVNYPSRGNFNHYRFHCHYHEDGETVTLTRVLNKDENQDRIDRSNLGAWFQMRVFDPETEDLPDFNSKTYVYLGIAGEKPPRDATLIIIHQSVETIKKYAFWGFKKMKQCIMHDRVQIIETEAFLGCDSLEAVVLSSSLRVIGPSAFSCCYSLHSIFFPTSLEIVGPMAFNECRNLRILSLPVDCAKNIQIGYMMLNGCHTYFCNTKIYHKSNQVMNDFAKFQRNLPPLHRACLGANVSARSVQECIVSHGAEAVYNKAYGGMTPMQIIALNPNGTTGAVMALFNISKASVFLSYDKGIKKEVDAAGDDDDDDEEYDKYSSLPGKTPLDCLLTYNYGSFLCIVEALCMHHNAMTQR